MTSHELTSCRSKVQFLSFESASYVLRRYRQRHQRKAVEAYRCTFCKHWHLRGPQ